MPKGFRLLKFQQLGAKAANIGGELETMRRIFLRNVDEKTEHVEDHLVDVRIAAAAADAAAAATDAAAAAAATASYRLNFL